jgi:predicted anti-sigma-YlaC factor YlaD
MTQWPINHLTADDLDAFHSASLSVAARQHLDECAECRALTAQDRTLLDALAKLPAFEPAGGFADRVMAQVQVRAPVPVRSFRPNRVALAATVVVALGASIVWSLFNRAQLLSWLDQSAAEVGRALWLAVRVAATNLAEQSWFAGLRGLASSSGRLALAGGGLLIGYGVAVIALRRLLVPPSRPASHANG